MMGFGSTWVSQTGERGRWGVSGAPETTENGQNHSSLSARYDAFGRATRSSVRIRGEWDVGQFQRMDGRMALPLNGCGRGEFARIARVAVVAVVAVEVSWWWWWWWW
jgi:hypothetical protein